MPGSKLGYFNSVANDQGKPIVGNITVYLTGTTTKASIYVDSGGVTARSNPFVSDSLGRFKFYAVTGSYDVVISGAGITTYTIPVDMDYVTQLSELTDIDTFFPEKNVASYVTLPGAVSAIGSTPDSLVINSEPYSITNDMTIPSTLALRIVKGGSIAIPTGKTLTINGPFEAGPYQVFICTGTGKVVFGPGAGRSVRPDWWGFSPTATAAVNATALQSAIDSDSAIINIPPGSFDYAIGLLIDRPVRFDGAGASGVNGFPEACTTELNYTGSGLAISVQATGANGMENFHLSNFSLTGTSAATGGILWGSTAYYVLRSSMKNVNIKGFTKTNAYGLRLSRSLESYFENITTRGNFDGVSNLAGDVCTTLHFKNIYSGSNVRFGFYLSGTMIDCDLAGLCAESNGYNGLYICGSGQVANSFIAYHSEQNQLTNGNAPIIIWGTSGDGSPNFISFWGGYIGDAVTVKSIDLNYCSSISFNYMTLAGGYGVGFMGATANTLNCTFTTWDPSCVSENVTGNHSGGVATLTGNYSRTWQGELRGSTGRAGTPVIATGKYTRIGNQVTATISFWNVDTTGATGDMEITGLPFAASDNFIGSAMSHQLAVPGLYNVAWVATGGETILFKSMSNNDSWTPPAITAASGKYLVVTLTYFV